MIINTGKTKKGKATFKKLNDSVLELFWRGSYHGVSVDEITKNCGLSKATFYSFYESKIDCIGPMLEDLENTFLRFFPPKESYELSDNFDQAFKSIFKNYNSFYDANHAYEDVYLPCPFIKLQTEIGTDNELAWRPIAEFFTKIELRLDGLCQKRNERLTRSHLNLIDADTACVISLLHNSMNLTSLYGTLEPIQNAYEASCKLAGFKVCGRLDGKGDE